MSRSDERIPVTIVTGFLGSGKTTLLNHAARSRAMANAAIVINEFGSVPLDHLLSEASNDQIVVLENGCLCCTVFGDLIATLNGLYHAREAQSLPGWFDRVVIETSGLADPRPVVQAFLSDPTLDGLYRLDSMLAVVDAINGPGSLERHHEAVHQLVFAEHILITKLDLLGNDVAADRERVLRRRFAQISPGAKVYRNDHREFDPVELLFKSGFSLRRDAPNALEWLNAVAYECEPESHRHSIRHETQSKDDTLSDCGGAGEKIASFCLKRERPITLYALELLLAAVERNLGPALLRLKGLVHVKERPQGPAIIHGAQHLLHNTTWLDHWPGADRSTRIVFITDGVDRQELIDMVELLDRVVERTASARERGQAEVGALD